MQCYLFLKHRDGCKPASGSRVVCLCPRLTPSVPGWLHLPCPCWHTALVERAAVLQGRGARHCCTAGTSPCTAEPSRVCRQQQQQIYSNLCLVVGKQTPVGVRNMLLLCLHKIMFALSQSKGSDFPPNLKDLCGSSHVVAFPQGL